MSPRDRSPVRTSSPRHPSGKDPWNQWTTYTLTLLQLEQTTDSSGRMGTGPPTEPGFSQGFFSILSPSFRSLPLSPLACLVGDTSFPAQSSTWLHRYLNWTKLDNAITKFDWFVFVYLDDILIFSQNKRDHVQHVRRVLQRPLENCLFVKVEKCQFHAWSVLFLGFIFSPEGIRMDPAKVKAVADWPTPDNRRAVQRFLGFANFYRRFIQNFSQVALPLTYLTSTKKQLCWSSQA